MVEVFLSSPSDVQTERALVVRMASEWNRLRGRESGCHISILTWEDMVAPELLDRPQSAVNRQIGFNYDVYLSLMWSRIGTSTGVAASGTVEEFEQALSRRRGGHEIRIASLFKKAAIDPDLIDPAQLQAVKDFRARVSEEGGFYREFSDEDSLRSILSLLFEQICRDYKDAIVETALASITINAENVDPDEDGDEEVGLIEIGDLFSQNVSSMNRVMFTLARGEEANNAVMERVTSDINRIITLGLSDSSALKLLLEESAMSMNSLSDTYETSIDELIPLTAEAKRLIDLDIKIRLEVASSSQEEDENIKAIEELSSIIAGSISQMDALIEATKSIPRLSGKVHKAKKRLIVMREMVRNTFSELNEGIRNSLLFYDDWKRRRPST